MEIRPGLRSHCHLLVSSISKESGRCGFFALSRQIFTAEDDVSVTRKSQSQSIRLNFRNPFPLRWPSQVLKCCHWIVYGYRFVLWNWFTWTWHLYTRTWNCFTSADMRKWTLIYLSIMAVVSRDNTGIQLLSAEPHLIICYTLTLKDFEFCEARVTPAIWEKLVQKSPHSPNESTQCPNETLLPTCVYSATNAYICEQQALSVEIVMTRVGDIDLVLLTDLNTSIYQINPIGAALPGVLSSCNRHQRGTLIWVN